MIELFPFVLATANPDKAREILEIFSDQASCALAASILQRCDVVYGFIVAPPDSIAAAVASIGALDDDADIDVAETGATLEANARIKAVALCEATGTLAIADDTGLMVDALDGAPGVHSARYAGPEATANENTEKLIAALTGAAGGARSARFATVAMARFPDGREVAARGAVEGVIAERPLGSGGFGYDPIFVAREGDGRTFAQMTPTEKHALSHRGRAFRALAIALTDHKD